MPTITLQRLDELLESGLLALYRRWDDLPRRSTLPRLEALRAELATTLEGLGPAPDTVRFEQCMVDFAASALALPRVKELAGTPLAKLAGVKLPLGPYDYMRVGLKATNSSRERVQALVQLLREPDPAVFAITQMYYVTEETRQAWQDLRGQVDDIMATLPDDVRSQVKSIDVTLEAESSPGARDDPYGPFERALNTLEQIPAVIRALGPEFMEWKTDEPAPTRRSGGLPQGHTAYPIREGAKSVEREEAELTGAMPETAGAEPEDNGQGAETSVTVNFYTDVEFPRKVKQRETHWLAVRLRLRRPESSAALDIIPVEFTKRNDEPPPPEYVDVRVAAPGFEEKAGSWERTITVYADRDSQPAVFLLAATESGERRVAIDFYHKGRMIGGVAFLTEVVNAPTSGANVVLEDPDAQFARLESDPPPPADLEIRVVKMPQANTLSFFLSSPHPEVGYHTTEMGTIELTAGDPMSFLAQELDRLSQMAAQATGELTPEDEQALMQELEIMGEGLFEQLFPQPLQDAYWTHIKPLRERGVIKTLLVTSDEPWIPWELVKPYSYDRRTDQEYSDDFLVESFEMCRWLAGRGPVATITVQNATLIMPNVGLPFVDLEKDFFNTLATQRRIQIGGPLQMRQEVVDILLRGGFQVLHIATHGNFNREDADRSELVLIDAALTPGDLQGRLLRGIRRSRPLVFLNACHGAQTAFGLTGLGGWADKMFKEAGVSAFVGALWEVNDKLAVEFSRTFYSNLVAGKTLGEALRTARTHVRELNAANPTWLAYTLYGDPNAKVTIGSA